MAVHDIQGVRVPFVPLSGINDQQPAQAGRTLGEGSFEALLQKELCSLKFSKHAHERIRSREMQLETGDLARLEQAVARAEGKGSAESLVLLRDMAFVVSVKNKTVITAVDRQHLQENVFTNIDSAIIV